VTPADGPAADTMMGLRAHARGGPERLVYEQAPAPVPGPGEALVAVHAAGITFAELTPSTPPLSPSGSRAPSTRRATPSGS
jgi:hypothetical protein